MPSELSDNERVDQWWLEVSGYADEEIHEAMGQRYVNPVSQAGTNLGLVVIPRWNDPGAWTPALYQKIEDAGLKTWFEIKLKEVIWDITQERPRLFHLLQATPAQKTTALSRALAEMEDKDG